MQKKGRRKESRNRFCKQLGNVNQSPLEYVSLTENQEKLRLLTSRLDERTGRTDGRTRRTDRTDRKHQTGFRFVNFFFQYYFQKVLIILLVNIIFTAF